MRERPDIRFLNDVLGFAVVAQNAAGDPVEPAIVRLHDRPDGRLIAAARTSDQFEICGRGGRFLGPSEGVHGGLLGSHAGTATGWMRQNYKGSRFLGHATASGRVIGRYL